MVWDKKGSNPETKANLPNIHTVDMNRTKSEPVDLTALPETGNLSGEVKMIDEDHSW